MRVLATIPLQALILLSLLSPPSRAESPVEAPFRICFFSLNNEKEFGEVAQFTKKLNHASHPRIEVVELMEEGKNTQQTFQSQVEKMAASGKACNGLVISGHHTGAFAGHRGLGSLSIAFLESLSCNPNLKHWFEQVNALWLQGCRTLGVGKIEPIEAGNNQFNADFHMVRVGNALEEDQLQQSFSDLNMEFSATLDQDNPLSSRYLRVFPRATVFGWTRTAPGVHAGSQDSLLFHIAHTSKIVDDRAIFFEDPREPKLPLQTAARYADILTSMLRPQTGTQKPCENESIQGWLAHGKVTSTKDLGFYNPDLNAYPSLMSTNNADLARAKELDCVLKGSKDKDDILRTLDNVLSSETAIGYSYNSIYGLVQRLQKEGDIETLEAVTKKLRSSGKLQAFLTAKLASPQLGLLRKIDYYEFYKNITGTPIENIEKLILAKAKEQLLLADRADGSRTQLELANYRATLFQSLGKHKLITETWLTDMLETPNRPDSLEGPLFQSIALNRELSLKKKVELFEKVLSDPGLKAGSLSALISYATVLQPTSAGEDESSTVRFLTKILSHPESAASNAADHITSFLGHRCGLTQCHDAADKELFQKVATAKNLTDPSINALLITLGNIVEPTQDLERQADQLIARAKNPAQITEGILILAAKRGKDLPKASERVEKIYRSKDLDDLTLSRVASAKFRLAPDSANAEQIFREIANHPAASEFTLGTLANELSTAPPASPLTVNAKALYTLIIESKKTSDYGLVKATGAITKSGMSPQDISELLKKAISSPKALSFAGPTMIRQIGQMEQPPSNSLDLIKIALDKSQKDPTVSMNVLQSMLHFAGQHPEILQSSPDMVAAAFHKVEFVQPFQRFPWADPAEAPSPIIAAFRFRSPDSNRWLAQGLGEVSNERIDAVSQMTAKQWLESFIEKSPPQRLSSGKHGLDALRGAGLISAADAQSLERKLEAKVGSRGRDDASTAQPNSFQMTGGFGGFVGAGAF